MLFQRRVNICMVYLQPLLRNPSRKLPDSVKLRGGYRAITPFKVIQGHWPHTHDVVFIFAHRYLERIQFNFLSRSSGQGEGHRSMKGRKCLYLLCKTSISLLINFFITRSTVYLIIPLWLYRVAQWMTQFLYALTSPNINRFSKLFHCQNYEKIL